LLEGLQDPVRSRLRLQLLARLGLLHHQLAVDEVDACIHRRLGHLVVRLLDERLDLGLVVRVAHADLDVHGLAGHPVVDARKE
jgi:hypothetical protein